jgi:CheY-like chemotaxis protein
VSLEKPLILIVDDESDNLTFLFDLLHNEGFRVIPVGTGDEALEAVARRRPRLVITDLRMPKMTGLELLDRIKKIAPETRVLILTAFSNRANVEQAMKQGGDGVIQRPCKNEDILNAVKSALIGRSH